MYFRRLSIFLIVLVVFASAGFAHAGAQWLLNAPVATKIPSNFDGSLNDTMTGLFEWGDGQKYAFGDPANPVEAWVKVDKQSATELWVAFSIPTPNDQYTSEQCDYVEIFVDSFHDSISQGNAPKSDDFLYRIWRMPGCIAGTVDQIEMYAGGGGFWTPVPPLTFFAASLPAGPPTRWTAEFRIMLDGFNTSSVGYASHAWDTYGGGSYSYDHWWPTGATVSGLNTWGDLTWTGAPGPGPGSVTNTGAVGNHTWGYDPENLNTHNVMMQFAVTAPAENVQLAAVELKAWGTGNDTQIRANVVRDANANGAYDLGDTLITNNWYPVDNGALALIIPPPNFYPAGALEVAAGTTGYFFITYEMPMNPVIGSTYGFNLTRVNVTGLTSLTTWALPGTPLVSGTKTVAGLPTTGGAGLLIPNHTWFYNPSADPYNEMLSFKIKGSNQGIASFVSITLQAFGTGNDVTGISRVYLVVDANKNGIQDGNDFILANATYLQDDGTLTLHPNIPFPVGAGFTTYFLVSYVMTSSARTADTFAFNVTGASLTDWNGAPINNPPYLLLSSAIKTTTAQPPQPQCTGLLNLTFTPNAVQANAQVNAHITGLSNCTGKNIKISPYACGRTPAASYAITPFSGNDITINFNAPASTGNYLYYACVDKNADNDTADIGEQDFDVLRVTGGPENCTIGNLGGCTSEASCNNIGGYWCNGACGTQPCPGQECTGQVDILVTPVVNASDSVTVGASGLSYCEARMFYVRKDSCSGATVTACAISNGSCTTVFVAPADEGNYTYFACFDINSDGNFNGTGESQTFGITVAKPSHGGGDWLWLLILLIVIIIAVAITIVLVVVMMRGKKPGSPKPAVKAVSPQPKKAVKLAPKSSKKGWQPED